MRRISWSNRAGILTFPFWKYPFLILVLVGHLMPAMAQSDSQKGQDGVILSETKRKQLTEDLDYGQVQKKRPTINPPVDRIPIEWGKIFLILTGLAILGIIIWQILSNNEFLVPSRQKEKNKLRIPSLEDAENQLDEVDLEPLIKRALQENDFKLAVRLYYLRSLKKLNQYRFIDWQKSKTNREYLIEVVQRPFYQTFHRLTQAFNHVWYGERPIEKHDFENLRTSFEELDELIDQER